MYKNFGDAVPAIDPKDTVLLLIDHQSGLFQCIGDMDFMTVRRHAIALAKAATLAGIPIITTASVPQGPNGPLIPEIHKVAPQAVYVARRGEINSWDCPDFVEAVRKTGRRTLVIAGTVTSVCLAFPAISAVHDGYKVFAVPDASGTYSKMAEEITVARMVQAGVVPIDTVGALAYFQQTWHRKDWADWMQLWPDVFTNYGLLLESFSKAQEVVKTGEPFDNLRED